MYTSEGFGGFVPAPTKAERAEQEKEKKDPLKPAVNAYNTGRYKDAEADAQRFIDSNAKSRDVAVREKSVEAQNILAFAAARRKDLRLARTRFAALQTEASKLPDKGKQPVVLGQFQPTLEEEGAYQHAVCTAALGDKKAAEAEYLKFMHDYPESYLLNGAIMRIQRLHNGHLPKEAEAAWESAQKEADRRRKEREKDASMCGPECLAELLRRRGEKADVEALGKEMKTSDEGTSLESLAECARKHGFNPEGLSLTMKGLSEQPLPLIALVKDHYVIVDNANIFGITVWDPYGEGINKPGTKHYSRKDWENTWSGIALVFHSHW